MNRLEQEQQLLLLLIRTCLCATASVARLVHVLAKVSLFLRHCIVHSSSRNAFICVFLARNVGDVLVATAIIDTQFLVPHFLSNSLGVCDLSLAHFHFLC